MVHRMKKQDDGNWIAVDEDTNEIVAGPDESHLAVVKQFREDPDFGEHIPLISDYRGMD